MELCFKETANQTQENFLTGIVSGFTCFSQSLLGSVMTQLTSQNQMKESSVHWILQRQALTGPFAINTQLRIKQYCKKDLPQQCHVLMISNNFPYNFQN